MNIVFVAVAGGLVWLHRRHCREQKGGMDHDMKASGVKPKRVIALTFLAILIGGLISFFITGDG